jgi:hypothetical protein
MENVMDNGTNLPAPIVCETRVSRLKGGEICVREPRHGDFYNLTTGEARVTRMIGGIRYDTADASLVYGTGEYFGVGCYILSRLYRTPDGKFFLLQMISGGEEIADIKAISVVEEDHVLETAKHLLAESELFKFLREWYCSGLLPLNDAFVQEWAESILSADECQGLLVALGNRHSPRTDDAASNAAEP